MMDLSSSTALDLRTALRLGSRREATRRFRVADQGLFRIPGRVV
jgi:hypothetical protein